MFRVHAKKVKFSSICKVEKAIEVRVQIVIISEVPFYFIINKQFSNLFVIFANKLGLLLIVEN
jgi:hypothetical protein